MFTYDEIKDSIRRITHRNASDAAHDSVIEDAILIAIAEMSGYRQWHFCGENLKVALEAGTRAYPMPTTNVAGTTIPQIVNVVKESFRVASSYDIEWLDDVSVLDQDYPAWVDASSYTGNIEYVCQEGAGLAVFRTPTAAYIASNPYLYFRGYRSIKYPDDSDANLPDWADAIVDIPNDWQWTLINGGCAWVYKQARSDRWANEYSLFRENLKQMAAKVRPAPGLATAQAPPSPVFRGSPSSRAIRSDYGIPA